MICTPVTTVSFVRLQEQFPAGVVGPASPSRDENEVEIADGQGALLAIPAGRNPQPAERKFFGAASRDQHPAARHVGRLVGGRQYL